MPTILRLLPYRVDDGPHNMAADEVLLESAAHGVASLRLYGWSEATVSLGYFQPERLRLAEPRVAALPFVRRPSGGAALVHHHEVTYALALPAGPPWQTGENWLCRMHQVLAGALGGLGVTPAACGPESPGRFTGLLCFQHFTPGDLLLAGAKVAGSAQRRHRGALLQHGAVLLAASPFAPGLPGIAELVGRRIEADRVCQVVSQNLRRETGWQLDPADWTPPERERWAELAASKYATDAWNRKR
jgi:lipoate-protein ligase A